MKRILLIALVISCNFSYAQIYLGIAYDASAEMSTSGLIDNFQQMGIVAQKPLSTTLSLQSALFYRYYRVNIIDVVDGTDFGKFWSTTPNNKRISDSEYYSVTYLTVPIGIEYKISPFLRLQYNLENNVLVTSNYATKDFLESGKKSLNRLAFNHNANVVIHTRYANFVVGLSTIPNMISNANGYKYNFMGIIGDRLTDTFMFTVGARTGFYPALKKKKVL